MAGKRLVRGEVRAIARGGDAVVETPGGIVLVPGALPGERVQLELRAVRRGVARGRLGRIVEKASTRREAPCKEVARCGGCPLMIAEPALQREIKLGFLREACHGLPGVREVEIQWVESSDDLGYRRRARLAWHNDVVGYRELRSNRVTDVEECIVLMEPLRRAWKEVRALLSSSLRGAGEIQLERSNAEQVVVVLRSDDEQEPALYRACEALVEQPVIAGVSLRIAKTRPAVWGCTQVTVEREGGLLEAPAEGFVQANDSVNDRLVEAVADLAEPDHARVLELYCGAGNFTVELAARAKALVAVEQDPVGVEACRRNLKRRGLDARVIVGNADQPPEGRYDVVVLDPPRQGAKALFENEGLFPGPARIVYVSCDTATLGRDLGLATKRGYRIDRIVGFDMFPQTAHLESLVRLVRA